MMNVRTTDLGQHLPEDADLLAEALSLKVGQKVDISHNAGHGASWLKWHSAMSLIAD